MRRRRHGMAWRHVARRGAVRRGTKRPAAISAVAVCTKYYFNLNFACSRTAFMDHTLDDNLHAESRGGLLRALANGMQTICSIFLCPLQYI